MAKYAISFTAVKLVGAGIIPGNGLNVVEAESIQEAKQSLDKFSLETCKPSDGFVGHAGSVMEIPKEKPKPTFKFG